MSSNQLFNVLNDYGLRILNSSDPETNISISPLALLLNWKYALQGSPSNEFIEQINHLLHLPSSENEKNLQVISELIKDVVNGDPKFVTLNLVGGLCVPSSVDCTKYLQLDNIIVHKGKDSIKRANEGISIVSENKIKCILIDDYEPINGITIFGVLHFKAPFLNLFNSSRIEICDFHVSSTKSVKIPMMRYGSMIMYNEDIECGVRMMRHYFYGGNFYIVVMVPINRFGLVEMQKRLTSEKYSHLVKTMRPVLGQLSIPRLTLSYGGDIKKQLQSLGIKENNPNEILDNFVHGVSMDLNEFGSNVPMRELLESDRLCECLGGFTELPERQEIMADEPFLMAVNYSKDSLMICLSRVLNPVAIIDN